MSKANLCTQWYLLKALVLTTVAMSPGALAMDEQPTNAPDLFIESVTPNPVEVPAGVPVTFTVVVGNRGLADAGPFIVAVWYDAVGDPHQNETVDDTAEVAGLAAGETVAVDFEVTYAEAGTYDFQAHADHANDVDEDEFEANNFGSNEIQIGDLDAIGGPGCGDGACGQGAFPFAPLTALGFLGVKVGRSWRRRGA